MSLPSRLVLLRRNNDDDDDGEEREDIVWRRASPEQRERQTERAMGGEEVDDVPWPQISRHCEAEDNKLTSWVKNGVKGWVGWGFFLALRWDPNCCGANDSCFPRTHVTVSGIIKTLSPC